jgi:hypothetical protein
VSFTGNALHVTGDVMLDWILNPYGVSLGSYVILWAALAVIAVGSVIAAIVTVVFRRK